MRSEQPSFTDIEYGQRRRVSKREEFLDQMDSIIPWQRWIGVIEPHYYVDAPGKRGRKAKPVETMLRMYLLQIWFNLSDEGVEDAIYDSYAMRQFMGLDFGVEQVPDATTLLAFRHLMEEHHLGEELFAAQNEIFEEEGWIMRGGSIVDATIIAALETLPLREVLHAQRSFEAFWRSILRRILSSSARSLAEPQGRPAT